MQNLHYDGSNSKISVRLENVSVEDIFLVEEAEINYFKASHNLPEIVRIVAISLSITDKDLLKMVQKQQKHLKDQKFKVEDITFDNGEIRATISQQAIAIPLSVTAKLGLSIDSYGGLTIDFPPLEGALGLIPIPMATIARQILEADEKLSRFIVVKQEDSDTISIVPRITCEKTILLNPDKLKMCDGNLTLTCTDRSATIQRVASQLNSAFPFPPVTEKTTCQCPACKKTFGKKDASWLTNVSKIFSGGGTNSVNDNQKCTATAEELVIGQEYGRALRKLKSTHLGYQKRALLLLDKMNQPEETLRLCDHGLDTYQRSEELSSIKALALSKAGKNSEALETSYINKQTKLFVEGKIKSIEHDLAGAGQKFEKAFAIEPFNGHFIRSLALTLRKRKHRPRSVRALWSALLLIEPDSELSRRHLGIDSNSMPTPAVEALEYSSEISERTQWFGKGKEPEQIRLAESIISKIAKGNPELYLKDPSLVAREKTASDTTMAKHNTEPLLPHIVLHSSIKTDGLDYSPHQALPSILTALIRRTALESIEEPNDDDGLIGNFLSSKVQEITKTENRAIGEGNDLDHWINKELRMKIASLCREFVNTQCSEESVQKAITNKQFAADRALCLMTGDYYSAVQVLLWKTLPQSEITIANKTGPLRYLAFRAKSGKDSPLYGDLLQRIGSLTHFATNIDSFISDKSILKPL